jgi:hypothetical protein
MVFLRADPVELGLAFVLPGIEQKTGFKITIRPDFNKSGGTTAVQGKNPAQLFKAAASTKKTILQPLRQVRAAGASRGENRVRSGPGRTRGRGDCGACAA